RRVLGLREIHRSELAGADQGDTQWTLLRGALLKHAVEFHFASSVINPRSTNARRAPSTPATRRVCMPSVAAASTLIALSSMNSTWRAGTPSASRTCSKYSASGFSLPTRYDGKLWWNAASSFHVLLKRSQEISLVVDT